MNLRVIPVALSLVAQLSCGKAADLTFRELPDAPQLIYQKGVPHTDASGRIQYALTSHSFFPRCAYETVPGSLAGLKDAGFNCFKPWYGLALALALPEAHQTGMQMLKEMLLSVCDFSANPACNPDANAAAQIAAYTSQIASAASDPSILGWYIEEEPTGCINAPSTCRERFTNYVNFRAAIKSVDAIHPSFDLDIALPYASALSIWNEMNSTGDIAVNDDYPFHSGNENSLENSANNTSRLVALNHQQKPVWITVQAFALAAATGMSWKMPTAAQLRAEVFAAIVHGATGIIYFAMDNWASRNAQVLGISAAPLASYPNHGSGDAVAKSSDIASSRALWNEAVSLNAELQRLQSVILSPTATPVYRVAVKNRAISSTPIRSLLKTSAEGVYTLLVVNIDNVPLTARFTLATPPLGLHSIDAAGSEHPIVSYGNSFTDSIEGFGIRIYQFR
jgi:hypothetical protein